MPTLKRSVPKYRKHKASGQAIVNLGGKDHYLGPFGTKASQLEYDRLVLEWLANGRESRQTLNDDITVSDLIARFWKFAKSYYQKNGKPTGTAGNFKPVLSLLRKHYGHHSVHEFGPLCLEALQFRMIKLDQSRRYVNENINRIRRVFKWGVSKELVPNETYQRLMTVSSLAAGRSKARETPPVPPISDKLVNQALPFMPRPVKAMVRLQRLTGCRPGEVTLFRPRDIDMTRDVWVFIPETHKTEHHGLRRTILIGKKGQKILQPFLSVGNDQWCFSPRNAEIERNAIRHEKRTTPLTCGNRPGTNRSKKPRRQPGSRYTKDSYARAIKRACEKAFPIPDDLDKNGVKEWKALYFWSPNRLRHSAATKIRKEFGLESAQAILGHSNLKTTEIYAERNMELARKVMRDIG